MTFNFPTITLPSGGLKFKFINDDGLLNENDIVQDYFLSIAKLTETVEESGIGGVLRVSDMEIEIEDTSALFKDNILNTSLITECRVLITLTVSGTEYFVFYGYVDLTTPEYTYQYINGSTKKHTAKFIIMSYLNKLDTATPSTLRTNILTRSVSKASLSTPFPEWGTVTCVSVMNVLDEIQKLLLVGESFNPIEHNISYQYEQTLALGFEMDFEDLYYYLSAGVPPADEPKHWSTTSGEVGSYLKFKSVKDVLFQICSEFGVYPLVKYNLTNDRLNIKLKQRGEGTVTSESNIGTLLKARERSFYGYDAIRCQESYDTAISNVYKNPSAMSDDAFDLTQQKFDFTTLIGLYTDNAKTWLMGISPSTPLYVSYVLAVKHATIEYTRYTSFLGALFSGFWKTTPAPKLLERTYTGVGIGGSYPIEIVDDITVDSVDYPVIEIQRDFVANEKTLKLVQY